MQRLAQTKTKIYWYDIVVGNTSYAFQINRHKEKNLCAYQVLKLILKVTQVGFWTKC